MITRFANPARFMRVSGTALPWLGGASAVRARASASSGRPGLRAARLPAGRERADHVRPCAGGVDGARRSICSSRSPARWRWSGAIRWPRSPPRRRRRSAPPSRWSAWRRARLWGRPMWGTWWVWDARLTSVLVLFFLYLGYIALVNAFDDPSRGAPRRLAPGLGRGRQLADHQVLGRLVEHAAPAGERLRLGGPTIALSMLLPLLVMAVGVHAAVRLAPAAAHAHRAQRAQGAGIAPLWRRRPLHGERAAAGARAARWCGDGAAVNALGQLVGDGRICRLCVAGLCASPPRCWAGLALYSLAAAPAQRRGARTRLQRQFRRAR